MEKRDYFEVLGLGRDADDAAIRKAYRKLAMQHHPDRNPDDKSAEEKFKEATEAYEVLKDPQKRQAYEQFGHAGVSGQPGFGGPGGGFAGGGIDMEEALRSFMRDFGFESFFGGGAGGTGRSQGGGPGRDLRVRVRLTLEEVGEGTKKQIKIKKKVLCEVCAGSGQKPGSSMSRCPTCNGQGQVRRVQRSILGQFVNVTTCPRCRGEGMEIQDPCVKCRGEGRVSGSESVSVNIPAGVSTGDYIPLRGQGEAGVRGAAAGDVLVVLEVDDHRLFERVKQDLVLELPVAFGTLALGGKVEVPGIDGSAMLKIPPGTQSHQIFRMRGKGLPHLKSHKNGDMLVRVVAWTPAKMGKDEARLLRELATLEREKVPGPRKPK